MQAALSQRIDELNSEHLQLLASVKASASERSDAEARDRTAIAKLQREVATAEETIAKLQQVRCGAVRCGGARWCAVCGAGSRE